MICSSVPCIILDYLFPNLRPELWDKDEVLVLWVDGLEVSIKVEDTTGSPALMIIEDGVFVTNNNLVMALSFKGDTSKFKFLASKILGQLKPKLLDELRHKRWLHKRGNVYQIRLISNVETDSPQVVYQRENDQTIWVRPLYDWMRSFEKIQEETGDCRSSSVAS